MGTRVFGLLLVRNEADIIALNVHYHLWLGFDRLLVVDNGSTDGTDRELQRLGGEGRVLWRRDDSPYQQSSIVTRMAREAYDLGADWILPIDADEFWHAPRLYFKDVLSQSTAGALRVQVLNFIQRRDRLESSGDGLRHMIMRTACQRGPLDMTSELVETQKIGYVEAMYPPKWISRASPTIEIAAGNHSVTGVPGSCDDTNEIVCLHAPLRSRTGLDAKADHGGRVEEAGYRPGDAWHVRRFRRLQQEGRLDTEWAANSYAGASIDVYGERHKVIFDPTLRYLVAPWLPLSLREKVLLSVRRLCDTDDLVHYLDRLVTGSTS